MTNTTAQTSPVTETRDALVRDLALAFAAGRYEGGETLFEMYANIALKFMESRNHAPTPDLWRPIETAPKDGSEILVSCGVGHPTRLAFWDAARNNCWSVWPGRAWIEPLYWAPLPALTDTSTNEVVAPTPAVPDAVQCARCNGDQFVSGAWPDMPDEPCPVCNSGAPSGAERVRLAALSDTSVDRGGK